jgi:hypothetical protein
MLHVRRRTSQFWIWQKIIKIFHLKENFIREPERRVISNLNIFDIIKEKNIRPRCKICKKEISKNSQIKNFLKI